MLSLNPQKLPDNKTSNPYHVYYQPDNNTTISYPAIVYSYNRAEDQKANNQLYIPGDGYTVTVIDRNPDSHIPTAVRNLPYSRLNTVNVKDKLFHTVFTVYV